MRRVLGAVVALLVAVTAAPAGASPPAGDLVIVADRSASGSVTLPDGVEIDWLTKYESKSPYVGLVLSRDAALRWGGAWFAEKDGGWSSYATWDDALPGGRFAVQLVTRAPVTIRLRVDGMSGRRVVRLRQPLAGGTGVRHAVRTTGTESSDAIDFTTNGPAMVVQHFAYTTNADVRVESFCTGPRERPCVAVPDLEREDDEEGASGVGWYDHWPYRGAVRASYWARHTGDDPEFKATHTLVAVPIV